MKILFDQGTPVPLRNTLTEHHVETAFECGWQQLSNGDLLSAAEEHGFDLLITTDQNLKYQQDLRERKISIIVLLSTSWPRIQQHSAAILHSVDTARAGSYSEIIIGHR